MKTILIAAVSSLLSSILFTPLVVRYFRRRGFGQEIRNDGPPGHLVKRGTPTMGGVAIIGSTVFGYIVAHVSTAIRGGGGPNGVRAAAAVPDGRAAAPSVSSTTSSRSAGSATWVCGPGRNSPGSSSSG